jgi:tetratricopeptide (TPR) repeat protein
MKQAAGRSKRRVFVIRVLFLSVMLILPNLVCGETAGEVAENQKSKDIYETRLDRGLRNTDPYSYLLIETARDERSKAEELLSKAQKFSPDLPIVYFELSKESLSHFSPRIFEAIDYFRQGINAYERNFWFELDLAGLCFASLVLSLFVSLSITAMVRFPEGAQLILHDMREDKRKYIFPPALMILSFFGPFAFLGSLFFLLGIYFRKNDKAVVYVALLSLFLYPLLLRTWDIFLSAPSPEMRAIVEVNERRDNRYALRVLRNRDDFASVFSYALALKREGWNQEAAGIFKTLTEHYRDPRIFLNLGNSYYGMGDRDAAIKAYEASIDIRPIPSAFYNLSQIYREKFDFPKGDEYFLEAAALDQESVAFFRSISGNSPNRFVVDETIPSPDIWGYVLKKSRTSAAARTAGEGSAILALVMAPLFYAVNRRVKHKASRCTRCGTVYCSRCSRVFTWHEMCRQCQSTLIRIEETESKERIARLLAIYQRQRRRRRNARLLSYLMPGIGQIYAGRILPGFLLLWGGMFFMIHLVLAPVTGPFPFTHEWTIPFTVVFFAAFYIVSLIHLRKGLRKGWL